jgi:hypothetical protein
VHRGITKGQTFLLVEGEPCPNSTSSGSATLSVHTQRYHWWNCALLTGSQLVGAAAVFQDDKRDQQRLAAPLTLPGSVSARRRLRKVRKRSFSLFQRPPLSAFCSSANSVATFCRA